MAKAIIQFLTKLAVSGSSNDFGLHSFLGRNWTWEPNKAWELQSLSKMADEMKEKVSQLLKGIDR